MPIFNPSLYIRQLVQGASPDSPLQVDANGNLGLGLPVYTVNATTQITSTSTTDVLITGMAITPVAGTYFAVFDMTAQSTAGGNSIIISLYNNGVQVVGTTRTIQFPTATLLSSGWPMTLFTQSAAVVASGTGVIDARWHCTGGTSTGLVRTLTLIRVG